MHCEGWKGEARDVHILGRIATVNAKRQDGQSGEAAKRHLRTQTLKLMTFVCRTDACTESLRFGSKIAFGWGIGIASEGVSFASHGTEYS